MRVIRLVQQLDAERQRREKAEREAKGLRGVLARMKAQRTNDAVTKQDQRRSVKRDLGNEGGLSVSPAKTGTTAALIIQSGSAAQTTE